MSDHPQTRPQPIARHPRQPRQPQHGYLASPIGDLIERHRAEMARVWQRHEAELQDPLPYEPRRTA